MSKRTVQKYIRLARGPQPWGQSWATFLRNHASQIWACDFVQTYDIFFRPLFAFFIVELCTREVVHVAVTRAPTSLWTAQQLRNATPFGRAPRFIIRDNDDKYWPEFALCREGQRHPGVAHTRARAVGEPICERFLGSARRECLDHVLILGERHLLSVIRAYVRHFNTGRLHQGIGQRVPAAPVALRVQCPSGQVVALPVRGGLHHEYRWAA